jgi:hypothetical protein
MSKSIADMMPSPNSSSISAFQAVDHHQLVEAVDQRVGGRHGHAGAAHRHLVEQRLLGLRQAEQLGRRRTCSFVIVDWRAAPSGQFAHKPSFALVTKPRQDVAPIDVQPLGV